MVVQAHEINSLVQGYNHYKEGDATFLFWFNTEV